MALRDAVEVMMGKLVVTDTRQKVKVKYPLLPTLFGIIIAMLFFGEAKEVNLSFYVGVVLVALSVFLQNRKVNKNENS